MLVWIRQMRELDFSQLMAVYEEGNRKKGLLQAEQDFYQYLRACLFKTEGAYYAVWQEGGIYRSALRIEPYKDGVLLAALETHPQYRRQGFAEQLIRAVLPMEKKIYSHVSKKNAPSLAIHEKCGFKRVSEQAVYLDGSVDSRCCTLCFVRND